MKICCREELCPMIIGENKYDADKNKRGLSTVKSPFMLNIRANSVLEQFSRSVYWLEGTILAMKDSRWTIRVN